MNFEKNVMPLGIISELFMLSLEAPVYQSVSMKPSKLKIESFITRFRKIERIKTNKCPLINAHADYAKGV